MPDPLTKMTDGSWGNSLVSVPTPTLGPLLTEVGTMLTTEAGSGLDA